MKMNTWSSHFIFPLNKKFVNFYFKQIDYKNKWILNQYSNWLKTTHDRNDTRPKRPTKIGRIDSPQNKAKMTQAKTTHGQNNLDSVLELSLGQVVCGWDIYESMHNFVKNDQLQFTSCFMRLPTEIVKHVGDAAGVPVSIGDKTCRSSLDHFNLSGLISMDSRK